jgi:hypothetical protein
LPRWDKHDPTDLEELTRWTPLIIFGGIALALIVILLVVLAFYLAAKLDPAEVAPEEHPGAAAALMGQVAAGVDFDRAAVANSVRVGAAIADQKQQSDAQGR